MIVDDHKVVRQGLQTFLALDSEIELVGTATNGQEALDRIETYKPDVVLMDLQMPVMDGFEATRLLRQRFPQVKILALTSFLQQETISQALNAGANGYLLKDLEGPDLTKAIKSAATSQVVLSPGVAALFFQPSGSVTEVPRLPPTINNLVPEEVSHRFTPREVEVLQLLAEGLTNKEIAYRLNLSEKTIKVHISIIMAKLNAQSRTQAALYAMRLGLTHTSHQESPEA